MVRAFVMIAGLMLAGCAPQMASHADGTQSLPADVAAFMERRNMCDHYRGEDTYDAGRAADLARGIASNCVDTNAQLKTLRRKYASNNDVIQRLAIYETTIE